MLHTKLIMKGTETTDHLHRFKKNQQNLISTHDKYCDENRTNIRKLTPNECRKLQGFPSDWKQVVSDCQAYKQCGNAVTVNVSYNLADMLFKYISEHKKNNW